MPDLPVPRVPPAVLCGVGALLCAALRGRIRKVATLLVPALALGLVCTLPEGDLLRVPFLGGSAEILPLSIDGTSRLFGFVFCAVLLLGQLYALGVDDGAEDWSSLTYGAGSLGVVFAGDWLTFFFFWELMAVASTFLIWCRRTDRALSAGFRYLLVHTLGGGILFAGIVVHLQGADDWVIRSFAEVGGAGFWLILCGFAINAAIPPLHAWLTDAYPEASVSGMVFLSAFTTKTAVYALARVFDLPGGVPLIAWAGAIMAIYGAMMAVLENDIRRLLAYHIVSQVGYMVCGVGIGTAMSLDGSAAHAFCHVLYKGLLIMGAGAVLHATGRSKLSELGGLWRRMPGVTVLYMIGAFSISGFPLFNGFVSKSIIISGAGYEHLAGIEMLLTVASVGTFLHTGLKLPWFTFFGRMPDDLREAELTPVPWWMTAAMAGLALLCTGIGVWPSLLYAHLPHGTEYHPYTVDHVLSTTQLLLTTAAGFFVFLPWLGGKEKITLDTDWFYRRPFAWLVGRTTDGLEGMASVAHGIRDRTLAGLGPLTANPLRLIAPYFWVLDETDAVEATYDENDHRLPLGTTVFWVTVGFCGLMLLLWWQGAG